jgi:hypothetical protein
MTDEEKIALKVACLRAVATLLAGKALDYEHIARCAHTLYSCIVKIDWEVRPT